jgi:hypothetical protein
MITRNVQLPKLEQLNTTTGSIGPLPYNSQHRLLWLYAGTMTTDERAILKSALGVFLGFDDGAEDVLDHILTIDSKVVSACSMQHSDLMASHFVARLKRNISRSSDDPCLL